MYSFEQAPNVSSSRLLAKNINNNSGIARLLSGSEPDTYSLMVAGYKPYVNMDVELIPLIYVDKPDYWGIEVVGTIRSGILLPAIIPFSTEYLSLANTTGKKGIEVIWADERQEIDIAPIDTNRLLPLVFGFANFAEFEVVREKFRYPCPKLLDPFKTCPAEVVIKLRHPRLGEVLVEARECLKGAAYAAAIAVLIVAILSGGLAVPSAAAATFEKFLFACLTIKGVSFAEDIEVIIDVEKK